MLSTPVTPLQKDAVVVNTRKGLGKREPINAHRIVGETEYKMISFWGATRNSLFLPSHLKKKKSVIIVAIPPMIPKSMFSVFLGTLFARIIYNGMDPIKKPTQAAPQTLSKFKLIAVKCFFMKIPLCNELPLLYQTKSKNATKNQIFYRIFSHILTFFNSRYIMEKMLQTI